MSKPYVPPFVQESVSYALHTARQSVLEARNKTKYDGPTFHAITEPIVALAKIIAEQKNEEIKAFCTLHSGMQLRFRSRGIGLDMVPGCFVCGAKKRSPEKNDYLHNICAYIDSHPLAQMAIASWFNEPTPCARIALYYGDQNFPQIKIGACDLHLPNLQYLHDITSWYGCLWQDQIAEARTNIGIDWALDTK